MLSTLARGMAAEPPGLFRGDDAERISPVGSFNESAATSTVRTFLPRISVSGSSLLLSSTRTATVTLSAPDARLRLPVAAAGMSFLDKRKRLNAWNCRD